MTTGYFQSSSQQLNHLMTQCQHPKDIIEHMRNRADVTTKEIKFRFLIIKGLISHNQTLGVFTVLGTSGDPYAIRLFPTGVCYHILSV